MIAIFKEIRPSVTIAWHIGKTCDAPHPEMVLKKLNSDQLMVRDLVTENRLLMPTLASLPVSALRPERQPESGFMQNNILTTIDSQEKILLYAGL